MSEIDEFYFPEEVFTTNILVRLPIKSLLRFKCVNKRFYSIICSPYFARLHLNELPASQLNRHLLIKHKTIFLSFDFDSLRAAARADCCPFRYRGGFFEDGSRLASIIESKFDVRHSYIFAVGSCDGLVCVEAGEPYLLYIWNPTTLECREIRVPEGQEKYGVVYGFRCDTSVKNDYKVVRICQKMSKRETIIIQVFSLSENSWTSSHEQLDGYGERPELTGIGVSVNDITYWLYKAYETDDIQEVHWWIIGYEWVTRKMKRVPPLPEWQMSGSQCPPMMYVMEGRLCACWRTNKNDDYLNVGMMKEGSWMKLYVITQSYVVYAMKFGHQGMHNITDKGSFAIQVGQTEEDILLVDLTRKPPRDARSLRIPSSANLVNYTQTLVSPFVQSFK
ncbi:hypothetical protein RND81_05G096300 [Saponaria officinalis]|uniref:F-box domain-containing protein n=1 Tax=Saponaria officinalis TaxID=3572 RepID=A0AAW1KU37_SAPOF